MATVNELLRSRNISHAIFLERYKTHELQEIIALMNLVDQELLELLQKKTDESFTKKRLEYLLVACKRVNQGAINELEKKIRETSRDFSTIEINFQTNLLKNAIPIKLDIVSPAPNQVYAVINARPFENVLLSEHIENIARARLQKIQGAINRGYLQGETMEQITRRIYGSKKLNYTDGLMEGERRGVASFVRTTVSHIANVAREETYKANTDIISGVQMVATLDGRTTIGCMNLDGKVFPPDSGPRPPFHWGCRTCTCPVCKSWKELGIDMDEAPASFRASMNGKVAATETYATWLKKQPEDFQNEVLGKTRAEMFRKGTPLDRFVDNGKVLTLKQLEKIEKGDAA